jgi:hypothetical protein
MTNLLDVLSSPTASPGIFMHLIATKYINQEKLCRYYNATEYSSEKGQNTPFIRKACMPRKAGGGPG